MDACTNVVNIFSSNEHGFGDVNISAILNSFQMGYDKRVRPNYGGKLVGDARTKNEHPDGEFVGGNHGPLFQIWDGEILAVIELKFVSIGEEVSQP